MRTYILPLLLIGFSSLLSAQTQISFKESQKIDPNQYVDIKGDAYLFPDFKEGRVSGVNGSETDKVLLNYNGYIQAFEVRQGDRFIVLDEQHHDYIIIPEPNQPDLIFVTGLNEVFLNDFVQLLYDGGSFQLVKRFKVVLSEVTVQNVGKREEFKRFKPQRAFFIVKGQGEKDCMALKGSKKRILETLGSPKLLDQYIKEYKLDLEIDADLISLVKYWATL